MNNKFKSDTNAMSKELDILIELVKNKNNVCTKKYNNEWFHNINWDEFLKLTKHHRVYPLVYLKLKKVAPEWIPSHVLHALKVEYQKNTFRMLNLSREMGILSKLFIENQIRSLFLKGPVIAYDLYGDISLRTSKDLDILIPEENLAEAETLLLQEGYEKEEVQTVLNELKWRYHHVTYFNPQKNIQIEIHWRLHPRPMKEPSFEELWTRKRTSLLTSHPVSFLGKEDLFLYLITHGSRHGWFRLRWLKDIDQILGYELNNQKINTFIKKYQYQRLVGQTSYLLDQFFPGPQNLHITVERYDKKLGEKAYRYILQIEEFEYSNHYLFSLKNNNQKIEFILLSLYPRFTDMEIIKLPKHLQFLYFILRPFLWMWRRIMKIPV
ncbi:nucleotidyltransferase domain-containing protein [Priestia megaterium]|uniref:nucleotidyltransferase domain-containing protein n=1 Tax=Priestia megaterium TaxID=1404 RepID=UPI0035B609A5